MTGRALAALLALALGGCASARGAAPPDSLVEPGGVTMGTWRFVDAATGTIADAAELEALAMQFPDSGSVRLRYLGSLLEAGELDRARAELQAIVARGYRFSPGGAAQIAAALGREPLNLQGGAADVVAASSVVGRIPAALGLIEDIERERGSGRLWLASIAPGGLFTETGDGGWREVETGVHASFGSLIQGADGTIWASAGLYDQTENPAQAFSGLVGLDPRTDAVKLIRAPAGATPADLAIGPDGTLYASDPLSGIVYRAAPGDERLSVLVPAGRFRSPQGLAPSADGRFLYLSDYRYGLALVDLRSGAIDRLAGDASTFLDGTDGLWLHGGFLIAMRNGARPAELRALELSADGRRIVRTRVVERAHPEWTEPLGGTLAGDALFYIGTGRWDRFGKGGAVLGDAPLGPTEIRRVAVGG